MVLFIEDGIDATVRRTQSNALAFAVHFTLDASPDPRWDSKGVIDRINDMSVIKIMAIVLIIAGLLGLVYGQFSYTRETQEAKLGPFELTVKDTQTVNVPVWAGVAAIVAGGGLLLFAGKKS
jgi:hypothetical protein